MVLLAAHRGCCSAPLSIGGAVRSTATHSPVRAINVQRGAVID